jgi:hypothetical protein
MVQRIMGEVVSSLRIKKMSILYLKTLFVGMLLQSPVLAQERQGLLLNAGLSVISDSNITRTAEASSDTATLFSPQLQFLSSVGQHIFVFDYRGDFAKYKNNSQYNYTDHDVNLSGIFEHSNRINSEFSLGYLYQVEEPGLNNAQTQLDDEFNELNRKSARAIFYYGSTASIGQFVLGLDHGQQRYTNNQQSFRDVDQNKATGTFFYRMAPKTRLLLEASVAKNDYVAVTQFGAPTSDDNLYLAGVEWEATAITSGTFKVGYQKKDFVDARFNDIDGLSYFLDMVWQPNTYTTITIGAKRTTSESAEQDIGGFITIGHSLGLQHAFSARTQFKASYTQDKSDFTFSQDRTDQRKNITIGITHSFRTWLDIRLNYRHIARSSNDDIFAFSSDAVELSLSSKFD